MDARRPIDETIDARFDLLDLAGAGGMGEVYRAQDRSTGQIVALKLLAPIGGDTLRFDREAAVLAEIEHPGVVKYVDHGVTETGARFLVMEWLQGEDLNKTLARGAMSVPDTVTLARRLADALAAAHARGVVHRDLKPANVFLVGGRVDSAKILDFGLAQRRDDARLTVPGTVIGTPAYMAPEQIRGDVVDSRADVYGLGAVVLRCLTGHAPFGGANALAILAKVVVERAPSARDARPETPAALDALIHRMLDKSRDARPKDAASVLEALDAIDAGTTMSRWAPSAVTTREQRVACVVLCATSTDLDTTMTSAEEGRAMARMRVAVDKAGGQLETLARNHWMVTIRDAPSPAEQAARAARAALAIGSLRANAPVVVATGRLVVSGEAQVGEVIDRASSALMAATASSLRGSRAAEDGIDARRIRIDDATADLLGERFETSGGSPWRSLISERSALVPMRTLLGKRAPCVGRAQEIAILRAALDESREKSTARAVLVTAGPGFGKSRLVHELLAMSQADAHALLARGDAMLGGSPFGLVSQVIRREAGIVDAEPLAMREAKLRAMCDRDFAPDQARRGGDFLGEMCGLSTPDDRAGPELRAARADITVMADAMREAWTDWIRALAARQPVLLVFEDIHGADLPSLRVVESSLESLADRPFLVVMTTRPEGRLPKPATWRAHGLQEIELGRLSTRASERLVREALGASADAATVTSLVERAAGNPFHLEELVRAVAAGRADEGLPDSVLGMIQVRLNAFSSDARRVLRAASVFGESFWAGSVVALMGDELRAAEVDAHLAELTRQEVIVRRSTTRVAHQPEYAFRHSLVRDAAYAMLTDSDRKLAHQLAGEWLERVGETDPAILAEHFDRAVAQERALAFLHRAAQQALEGNDFDRAMHAADRAIACNPGPVEMGELLAIQAEVLYWRGDLDAAAARASAAAERLAAGSVAWFDAASVAVGALGQRGLNDGVAEWLSRATAIEVPPGAPGDLGSSKATRAQVIALSRGMTQLAWAHHGGPVAPARARLDRAFDAGSLDPYAEGWLHRVRGESAWLFERDVDRCLTEIDASCRAFERARALRPLCLARLNGASLTGWSGEIERGLSMIKRSEEEATRLGSPFLAFYAVAVKGLLLAYAGNPGARDAMEPALVALKASPRLAFVCHFVLGHLALDREDVDLAGIHAREAIAIPVVRDLKPAALALSASVSLARGEIEHALEEAREAVVIQSACRDLELTAGVADLALAEALEAAGEHDEARSTLAEAHAMLKRIAETIASPERRARFWSRRLPNMKIRDRAEMWGIAARAGR